MSRGDIRVLVVDDSPTVRAVVRRILARTPDLAVVGEAGDGETAVRLAVDLEPDVILMDVVMPGLDGFEATARIMQRAPTAVVVFSTAVNVRGHRVFDAYSRGARDVLVKPGSPRAWTELAETLPERLRTVAVGFRDSAAAPAPPAPRPPAAGSGVGVRFHPIRYLAVGASTGGPEALRELLANLAPRPPMAVLVVQHIAREFEAGLVDWLRTDVDVDVAIARHGERPQPGSVRLAPQDYHLRLEADGWLRLDGETPPIGGHRPAADVLLTSCAATAGRQAAGILLSGMGRDGVAGLQALRNAGGLTLVQDQASSVVFGMPQAALAAGAADVALDPARLARHVLRSWGAGPAGPQRGEREGP